MHQNRSQKLVRYPASPTVHGLLEKCGTMLQVQGACSATRRTVPTEVAVGNNRTDKSVNEQAVFGGLKNVEIAGRMLSIDVYHPAWK